MGNKVEERIKKLVNRKNRKRAVAFLLVIVMMPVSDIAGMKNSYDTGISGDAKPGCGTTVFGSEKDSGITSETSSEAGSAGEAESGGDSEADRTSESGGDLQSTEPDVQKPEVYEDLVLSSDHTLTDDLEVGKLTVTGGTVQLNGNTLKVHGDVNVTGGRLDFSGGSLYCDGSFSISGNTDVTMSQVNDYLYVKGNITWNNKDYRYSTITDGVIELCGDFIQTGNRPFGASGSHKVIFSGNEKQNIMIREENVPYTCFNVMELNNHSKEGVCSLTAVKYNTLIRNGCTFTLGNEEGNCGVKLTEDVTTGSDYILMGDVLDLDGHTMTVNGDFIHAGGTVKLNGGTLHVTGDYRIQVRNKTGSSHVYSSGYGLLVMTDENDRLIIDGDFITQSLADHEGMLTAGVLELKGNMSVSALKAKAFAPSDSHKVLFSGADLQIISFNDAYYYNAYIQNAEICNTGQGVRFVGMPYIRHNVSTNGCTTEGSIGIGTDTAFEGNRYAGDVTIRTKMNIDSEYTIDGNVTANAEVDISGKLNVGGNYVNGDGARTVMQGGRLYVEGNLELRNYTFGYGLCMKNENDLVQVNGDFQCHSYYSDTLSAGILEVAGNFISDGRFTATKNHRVVLSGKTKQTVEVAESDRFAVLEIDNHSEEGVYSQKVLVKNELVRNGCRLTYGDMKGEFGWTLNEDETYEGDLVLIDDELNLAGHTLTIKGNLIQPAGTVNVGGGKLIIEGDYRIQSEKTDHAGTVTYAKSAGLLIMQNDPDYVEVGGNFTTCTAADHSGYLTAGTFFVAGDMTVNVEYNGNAFMASENHRVVLCGDRKQTVDFGNYTYNHSKLQNLEITNRSSEGVCFKNEPFVSGQIKDNGNTTSGMIGAGGGTVFENNVFNGNVHFLEEMHINEELTVRGNVESSNYVYISGIFNIGGSYTSDSPVYKIVMQEGKMQVGQNLTIIRTGDFDSGLYMTHDKDVVEVGGDFYTSIQKGGELSAGILKVKGDFTTVNFKASGSHRTVLCGDKKQTIRMGGSDRFAVLELENTSDEGIYSENAFTYDEAVSNGCMVQIGSDIIRTGMKLEKDMEADGDFVLGLGTMDLNGHTFTVQGDLVQSGGEMRVNGGTLKVNGDYRIQSRVRTDSTEAGAHTESTGSGAAPYTYGKSAGILTMTDEKDVVIVTGDFVTETAKDHKDCLTGGTLYIAGNMTVSSEYSRRAFCASGKHKTILNGDGEQTVTFSDSSNENSKLADLAIMNESGEGVCFAGMPFVSGHIKDNRNAVSGYISIGEDTSFENGIFNGSVRFLYEKVITGNVIIEGDAAGSAAVHVKGQLRVGGNYANGSSGRIIMEGGTFITEGNLGLENHTSGYGLNMTHESDYVCVEGDFNCDTYYIDTLSAGTLEVKGDFTAKNFRASKTHRTVLSGDHKQTVTLCGADCFNILELHNLSDEGVYSENPLTKAELIMNGSILRYAGTQGLFGWKLDADYVSEEDFVLLDAVLDLNGHTLTVRGDFVHMGGEVRLNGGKLIVEGDYRGQSRKENAGSEDARQTAGTAMEYTYGFSSGKLVMDNEKDDLKVTGDFIVQFQSAMPDISAGNIEIAGNIMEQGNVRIAVGGSGVLTLNGNHAQKVKGNGGISAANLVISNTGSEEILLESDLIVSDSVKIRSGKVSGTASLVISSPEIIKEGVWSGNLAIRDEKTVTLRSDLMTGGRLTVEAPLHTGGHSIYAGLLEVSSSLYIENGAVYIQNQMKTDRYGKLIMQEGAGYVLVCGNFVFASEYGHDGLLTAGTVEVRGDFLQEEYANFMASSEHQVILSGKKSRSGRKYIQTVSFTNPGEAHFNRLVLKKDMSWYRFYNDVENICRERVNDIEDMTPPSEVTEIHVLSRTVSEIEISYSGAEDENGIMGYEIYRNGKKAGVTGETSFKDVNLEPDTAYVYSVYAFDEYGNTAESSPEESVSTIKDAVSPSKPENLRIKTRTGSGATISWDVSRDDVRVAGYRVYRDGVVIMTGDSAEDPADTDHGENTTDSNGIPVTTKDNIFKDTGLEKNTVYTYCVEAVDSSGNVLETSDELNITAAQPQIISVTPQDNAQMGGTHINLSVRFKNVGNSTGNTVKIEYSNEGGEWNMVSPTLLGQRVYDKNTLYADYTWNIERLKGGKEYTIRYTLTDSDGNTDVKEARYKIDREAPQKVAGVKAEDNEGIIKIGYDASKSADCEGYRIYRRSGENGSVLIKELHGRYTTEYQDTDVTAGGYYEYVITAYDRYNNESEASVTIPVVAGSDTGAPVIRNITPGAGKVNGTVHMTVAAEDNIKVNEIRLEYRKEDITGHGAWTVIESKTADASGRAVFEWDSTGLEDGVYIIRAVASDSAGNQNTEEYTRRYTVDNTGISKMTITGATCLASAISIRWGDVTEDDLGYFMLEMAEQSADGTYSEFKTAGVVNDTLGYTVTGLKPDTDYAFRAVGYDSLGNRGTASDIYTASTVKDETAPQITSVYPAESRYKDVLDLKMTVKDNAGVEKGTFYYSTDNVNFTEIVTLKVDGSTDRGTVVL